MDPTLRTSSNSLEFRQMPGRSVVYSGDAIHFRCPQHSFLFITRSPLSSGQHNDIFFHPLYLACCSQCGIGFSCSKPDALQPGHTWLA